MKLKAVKKAAVAFSLLAVSSFAYSSDYVDAFEAASAEDYTKAASIWQKMAEKGDPTAQFNMGLMYHSGAAGQLDEKQAVTWYQRAAENGHTGAQEYLAAGYLEGWFGLDKDMEKYEYWTQRLNQ